VYCSDGRLGDHFDELLPDLAMAIRRVHQVAPRLALEAWFTRCQSGAVSFERVASGRGGGGWRSPAS
jgi:hypothetical protein